MAQQSAVTPPGISGQLLLQVAEQLKLPLLQIGRQAEISTLVGAGDLSAIQTIADSALRLIDNYTLSVRLALDPAMLAPEAVTVSSVLYDAGHELSGLARSYGVNLELDISGRYGPVMANRQGLQAAIVSLGSALIEALPALESRQLNLRLATHRSRFGIVAGIYSDAEQMGTKALRHGRNLQATSTGRQPFMGLSHTAGAGILVADTILRAMRLDLKASRHQRLYGLGTLLQPNPQLQLV